MEIEKEEQPVSPRPLPQFIFRGHAVAGSGFLTRLDNQPVQLNPDVVTVHGESALPVIGGVSHSKVDKPVLAWPDWISYDSCETFAEGVTSGGRKMTTVRASVSNVRVKTRPSSGDKAPGVESFVFQADRFAIGIQSVHPLPGEASFELMQPEIGTLSLTSNFIARTPSVLPIKLEFDDVLMRLTTLSAIDKEFMQNEEFFNLHAPRFRALGLKLVFSKSAMPRTSTGYVITSIVKRISVGDQVIEGNVLTQSGFGRIEFGNIIINGFNRRISTATIFIGSDPGGEGCCAEVCTNGSWGN